MRKRLVLSLYPLAAITLVACQAEAPLAPANSTGGGQTAPITDAQAAEPCGSPSTQNLVLVDASHDGGVWWYPQVAPFDPAAPHQGLALASYLRLQGYQVDELGRGSAISPNLLRGYSVVIRAGSFGGYDAAEVATYRQLVSCRRTLLLLGEYLRPGQTDAVAEALGIPFTGWLNGAVTVFAPHPITTGVTSLHYIAGATLASSWPADIQVLGRLGGGEPVMGLLERGQARIFFIGDTNGIELVPQPLVDNLIAWGFPAP